VKKILAGALLAGTIGCAYVLPPVTIVGPESALRELVGEWRGDYRSEGPIERRGTIQFTLIEGEDHAHGDVLMIPAGSNRPYGRFIGEPGTRQMTQAPEPLSIRIVRVKDGTIRGELERYFDPDRETTAATTFHGSLREDTIVGTFTTTFASGTLEGRGRWRVTRVNKR
jgi:hypothetical protein